MRSPVNFTRADIVDILHEEIGLNRREARELVSLFFEEIILSLEQGEEVKLWEFGNFTLRQKRERPGRNPRTGEEVPVSARRVVTFRASRVLRSRMALYGNPSI